MQESQGESNQIKKSKELKLKMSFKNYFKKLAKPTKGSSS
jgi:hypothetical protein